MLLLGECDLLPAERQIALRSNKKKDCGAVNAGET